MFKNRFLLLMGAIVLAMICLIYLTTRSSNVAPDTASSPVSLIATAPDGTKLWGVQTQNGAIYFTSTAVANRHKDEPMPPPVQ